MRRFISQIENIEKVSEEIAVLKKNGKDYSIDRGRTQKLIDRLHPKKVELVLSEIIGRTDEAKTFRFVSKNGYLPPFEAGQYINIFAEIDGVRTSRPYSLSSSPRQRAYYDITIARIKRGFVSDYFLDKAKVGDSFEASAPAGEFHYNPVFHGKDLVFLAGGSGITPFMSMTKEVLNVGLDRNIHLIYGARTEKSAIFLEELRDLSARHDNFKFTLIVSEPTEDYKGETGFITGECIKKQIKNLDSATFYICGPQVMYDFCKSELSKLGVENKRIHQEMFGSRQDIQNEPGWPENLTGKEEFTVNLSDGRKIKVLSGESLLTSLERAGVRVNVCCRSGECSLCRVKLVSGKVFMPRGVLLRYVDEKYGYIHSCKAYPMSDLEVIL
ncbi:FAD-binding oxidoreductase [Clostridium omnivorum]|uniref:Hybrid-cluster NAD(P)-dependent oxidoreductase n=1 Tax=Clostridium omnivorum TaxID=1604902 RepID=A0ABQ5N336_9CLOT|nr:FAD-binding oxidoreductase [Clostridium sp. E14]GLC29559.1 hybrid-cluster NAD(P)-dependent oxidoreductase [Clostridium sp. E14]